MERSKTTEQGAVLTELNNEPGVIQFEYQSQIIEKFTGKIKQTSAGWMVLVETPKKTMTEKLTQIVHFLTPGKTSHDFATGHNGSERGHKES